MNNITNILITGKPRVGKTTLIKEIAELFKESVFGFYTQETRKKKKRTGFEIISFKGEKGMLASVNFKSKLKVGKYKVKLKDLEKIAVESVLEGLENKNSLIIIDEIGKMELISEKFKRVVKKALNSENKILGTIKLHEKEFNLVERKDSKVLKLKKNNKKEIKRKILHLLQES